MEKSIKQHKMEDQKWKYQEKDLTQEVYINRTENETE